MRPSGRVLHEAIAAYALERAGTAADLDRDLERAGLEALCSAHPARRALDHGRSRAYLLVVALGQTPEATDRRRDP